MITNLVTTRSAISRYIIALAAIVTILVAAVGATALVAYSGIRATAWATTVSPNGIEVVASVNSTTISVGQTLNISISLFNTLPTVNNVTTSTDDWNIRGFPVAIWPPCSNDLPIEFSLVKGDYSSGQLMAMNGIYKNQSAYGCAESDAVQNVAFQPSSSHVNLTALVGVNNNLRSRTIGPYDLVTNFTVNGYWWYPITAADAGDLNTPVPGGFNFVYPEASPTDSTPFVPGVYTLAIGDEWGQMVLIHFTVNG